MTHNPSVRRLIRTHGVAVRRNGVSWDRELTPDSWFTGEHPTASDTELSRQRGIFSGLLRLVQHDLHPNINDPPPVAKDEIAKLGFTAQILTTRLAHPCVDGLSPQLWSDLRANRVHNLPEGVMTISRQRAGSRIVNHFRPLPASLPSKLEPAESTTLDDVSLQCVLRGIVRTLELPPYPDTVQDTSARYKQPPASRQGWFSGLFSNLR